MRKISITEQMNHISNMLINTYKLLNTLPDLIPRNFKLMCTCKHTHTQSGGSPGVHFTPAAPCSPLIPPQVGVHHCGGAPLPPACSPDCSPACSPWRASSAVPVRGQGAAAGYLCNGHIRFWLLVFLHHDLHILYKLRYFFYISFQAYSFVSKVNVIPSLLFTLA